MGTTSSFQLTPSTIHAAAMIVDPVEAFKATSSVAPLPTVVPSLPEYQTVTETGTRTLWAVFVLMLLSMIVFVGMSWTVPISKRLYHIITTLIVTFASLSYFAMASGHGEVRQRSKGDNESGDDVVETLGDGNSPRHAPLHD